jgi:hypothetical protein
MHTKRRTKPPPQKLTDDYRRLWRIIDGAVADAFNQHPNYFSGSVAPKKVRASINKRVVGSLLAALSSSAATLGAGSEITPADRT